MGFVLVLKTLNLMAMNEHPVAGQFHLRDLKFVNRTTILSTIVLVFFLSACGGGSAELSPTSESNRNVLGFGEIIEAVEDGGSVYDDVSKNDVGDNLSYSIATGSSMSNGLLEFSSDGTFTYTPNTNFFGQDSVEYIITDSFTGETAVATLTIDVVNDYESLDEYGWKLEWEDDFNAGQLDGSMWESLNTDLSGGNLRLTGEANLTAKAVGMRSIKYGRIEASVRGAGVDVLSSFRLVPVTDAYDGENALNILKSGGGIAKASADYGLGLVSGVLMNSEMSETLDTDFHKYAIEWGEKEIRWYINDDHVHTVDNLHTWGYSLSGGQVIIDNDGPFNQEMAVVFDLSANTGDLPIAMMVDYIKVWVCDPSVEQRVEECASGEKTKISKLASNRIESVQEVSTDIFIDGVFDPVTNAKISDTEVLTWHYDDDFIRQFIVTPSVGMEVDFETEEGEHGYFLDVQNSSGNGTLQIGVESGALELVGKDISLDFDLYLDGENFTATDLKVGMLSADGQGKERTISFEALERNYWTSFSISITDFLADRPEVEGTNTGLDLSKVTVPMTLFVEGSAHLRLDNIRLTCVNSEGCVQFPLLLQTSIPKADPIRYEAESFISSSGTGLQDTSDEGGGQNVAFISAGDSLVYSIEAPGIGPYSIDYRVASAGGSNGFSVSIDGEQIDRQTIPDTGDWQNWTTLTSQEFELAVGVYTLKLDFLDGDQNLNWFQLQPPITQICVQAEDFDDQSGISLEDTLDTEPCAEGASGGGENIGYIDLGDYVEYSISVPSDGNYLIEYRLASEQDSEFELSIGGVMLDARAFEGTGGWQEWTTRSAIIPLTAGEQIMRLDFLGGSISGAININWIRLTRK